MFSSLKRHGAKYITILADCVCYAAACCVEEHGSQFSQCDPVPRRAAHARLYGCCGDGRVRVRLWYGSDYDCGRLRQRAGYRGDVDDQNQAQFQCGKNVRDL